MVLRAQRNLKIYLRSILYFMDAQTKANCFFSGHTTKAKTTIQSFKKESVLTFRLVKKKKEKKDFACLRK